MFRRFRQWRDAAVVRDVDYVIWSSTLEHLARYCIENPDDDMLLKKLREHITRGAIKGFVPHIAPKSNKKSLEIK